MGTWRAPTAEGVNVEIYGHRETIETGVDHIDGKQARPGEPHIGLATSPE